MTRLLTGGKDCVIRVIDYNEDYKVKMNFDIYSLLKSPLDSHIRAIAVHEEKSIIAVGLLSGDIYEFDYG